MTTSAVYVPGWSTAAVNVATAVTDLPGEAHAGGREAPGDPEVTRRHRQKPSLRQTTYALRFALVGTIFRATLTPNFDRYILIIDNFVSFYRRVMTRQRAFAVAGWIALAAVFFAALATVLVSATAVGVLTGRMATADVLIRIPGTDPLEVAYQPSWNVSTNVEVCSRIVPDLQQSERECEGLFLHGPHDEPGTQRVVVPGHVRAVAALLEGRLLLEAKPGWNPLIASLYGMSILRLVVLTFLLAQLWLLLRAASNDAPFTDRVVRRLRTLGATLVAWEVLEPLLWVFLSPKAWDYGLSQYGTDINLELGSMEPGFELTKIVFGVLLLLLAEIFKRGAALEHEQKLTV